MARVVLVWNEHPTEVVAGYHARKVARILKEKYGHEVILDKIPVSETNYGALSKMQRPSRLEKLRVWLYKHLPSRIDRPRLVGRKGYALNKFLVSPSREKSQATMTKLWGKPSIEIADEKSKLRGAPCFNFHCTRAERMGNALTSGPANFRVGATVDSEIVLEQSRKRGKQNAVVELPAFYEELPKKALRKQKVRYEFLSTLFPLNPHSVQYYFERTPLNHPEQQKFLHPAISEKIAAAIHERITRRK